MHWSQPFIQFLRSVVPEIAHVPVYLLRSDESGGEWESHWMATFSPLADLRAQSTLERLGLWSGRGVLLTVRHDFDQWSARCKAGTLLHELAHVIEFLSQPDALADAADLSPVARELLSGSESEILAAEGICRSDLIRGQHGPQFVRYATHLFWRARQRIILAPSDVQFLATTYSLSPVKYDAVMESLASELAMSWNLNLLRLRLPPAEFTQLFS